MIVKICGITNEDDLLAAIELKYTMVGFVQYRMSRRYIEKERTLHLIDVAKDKIKTVAVGLTFKDVEGLYEHVDYIQIYEPYHSDKLIYAGENLDSSCDCSYFLYDKSRGSSTFEDFPDCLKNIRTKLILAGGLTRENVVNVIKHIRPIGVDVSSGVEKSPGIKDIRKTEQFINTVRSVCKEVI